MDATLERPIHENFINTQDLVKWVEGQPDDSRMPTAQGIFDDLLAKSSQLKATSGNSCIKLCGFVAQCTKSKLPEIQEWAYTEEMSLKLFNFFIEWNEVEAHRHLRLVLDLLPNLINQNPDSTIGSAVKLNILDTLVSIVGPKSSRPLVKSSMKALDQFTSKRLFSVEDIGQSYRRVHAQTVWSSDLDLWRAIFAQLFHRMITMRANAGKLVVTLYQALQKSKGEISQQFTVQVWLEWLQEALTRAPMLLDSVKNYVFLPVFKQDRAGSLRFLEIMKELDPVSVTSEDDEEEVNVQALLRFNALEIGKKVGIVDEPGGAPSETKSAVVLEEAMLDSVLSHPSSEVRSLALSLIISSNSTTRPFFEPSLRLLQTHLPHHFSDPSARFRMELLSKVKAMYRRARGAIPLLQKALHRVDAAPPKTTPKANKIKVGTSAEEAMAWPKERIENVLAQHKEFVAWFLQFLKSELIPTASYQRHFSILRATLFIIRIELDDSKVWDSNEEEVPFFSTFDTTWTRILFDLVMDAFEDVRAISNEILMIFFTEPRFKDAISPLGHIRTVTEFLRRAEDITRRTARADHSDGLARSYELLSRIHGQQQERLLVVASLVDLLESKLSLAEIDLGKAVLEAPIYGYFASLRFVWESLCEATYTEPEITALDHLQFRLVKACRRIWATVSYVLCDDSPEGHLPQELEDIEGLDTKDLLSYSFRAIHESSNLMRAMIVSLKSKAREGDLRPSVATFSAFGQLTFDQLTNLRHRGAFSTVSLTFATCCQLVQYSGGKPDWVPEGETLLDVWYKCILTHASTTRRSAGIPSMITGILSADAESPSFDRVIADLTDVAQREARVTKTDGSNLPQVHALNCLKDIFKSAHLAQMGKVERHIPQCLELAAGCLKAEVWAIRNSGLLLLRSLIDNLFGTNESKTLIEAGWDGKASRVHYHKYPIIPVVLLNLLRSGQEVMKPSTGTIAAESVFPALDIIRRAGPPEDLRAELYGLVTEYLGSPVWHVREMTARALCSFLLHDGWLQSIQELVDGSERQRVLTQANRLHGVLLTIKYVFEKLANVLPELAQRDTSPLLDLVIDLYKQAPEIFLRCPEAHATYAEILNVISAFASGTATTPAEIVREDAYASYAHSALLSGQIAVQEVYQAASSRDVAFLALKAIDTASSKPEAAVDMLEAIPVVFQAIMSPELGGELCKVYLGVGANAEAPEPRIVALENLADTIDDLLGQKRLDLIPSDASLTALWNETLAKSLNPGLSNAVIRLSGSIMATSTLRQAANSQGHALDTLQNWTAMISAAGHEDQPFDTRFAATQSLKSYLCACPSSEPALMPVLLTLYDALNDDDEEVRALAALASRPVLANQTLLPLRAADSLLQLLHLPAGVDDAALGAWAADGVKALKEHVEKERDGPLGWTGMPDAYAVCIRVLLAARAVVARQGGEAEKLRALTAELKGVASDMAVHGMILELLG
ncbi:GTP-binding protein rhoA [Verticillium dahliae VDG1]|nr:GTP-binding protein rhoA [Verticillium dahliae VDG1]